MLATANMIPDLRVFPNTTDVVIDISRQSLRVASLIHEYTKLFLPGDFSLYPVKLQASGSKDCFSQSELSKFKAAI
jgi:hypothetical protein